MLFEEKIELALERAMLASVICLVGALAFVELIR